MKSILVIDDDAIRRTAMATDLREQGVDVNEQADLVLDTLGAVDAIVAVDEKVLDALNAVLHAAEGVGAVSVELPQLTFDALELNPGGPSDPFQSLLVLLEFRVLESQLSARILFLFSVAHSQD
mgnify:CR=1 FL=1